MKDKLIQLATEKELKPMKTTNYNTYTLNPWIEFIEEIEKYVHESNEYERGCKLTFERKDFLKQSPKLGDFIATNKKGEVLEEPEYYKGRIHIRGRFSSSKKLDKALQDWKIRCNEYQQAQERVKFEGWDIMFQGSNGVSISNGHYTVKFWNDGEIGIEKGKTTRLSNTDKKIKTYSDLTGYGLKMIVR